MLILILTLYKNKNKKKISSIASQQAVNFFLYKVEMYLKINCFSLI